MCHFSEVCNEGAEVSERFTVEHLLGVVLHGAASLIRILKRHEFTFLGLVGKLVLNLSSLIFVHGADPVDHVLILLQVALMRLLHLSIGVLDRIESSAVVGVNLLINGIAKEVNHFLTVLSN